MKKIENEQQLIFLYDHLMLKEVQKDLKIRASPVCFAMLRGSYWKIQEGLNKAEHICLDTYERRERRWVYGMVFVIDHWNFSRQKVEAYYGSMQKVAGKPGNDSIFELKELEVVPFSLEKLNDLKYCKFKETRKPLKVIVPVFNKRNMKVAKWIRYRDINYVDVQEVLKSKGWSEERREVEIMGWNDIFGSTTTQSVERVEFAKIPEGTTTIRILDEEPFSIWQHWIGEHRMSVRCAGKEGDCPICEIIAEDKGNGVTPRYGNSSRHMVRIWNYDTNREEILAQGVTFWRALGNYRGELGDLRGYDVKIIRKGADRNTNYTILPLPPSPFEHADKIQDVDFERIFPKHDRQTVLRILDQGRDALKNDTEDVPF